MKKNSSFAKWLKSKNVESHRVPEERFVKLDLKVLLQETGVSPSVTSKLLQNQNQSNSGIIFI